MGFVFKADIVLISTSDENGLCFIETAELDGETNLKVRQALEETQEVGEDINKLSSFDGRKFYFLLFVYFFDDLISGN
jgi:magnesium-transporting ATPase (P-type)